MSILRKDDDLPQLVLRKLERFGALSEADGEAIRALRYRTESVATGHHLVREGDKVAECCVLVSGYACRHKTTSEGGRQIVSFHIPGDFLDLQHLLLARADHSVQAMTKATVAWLSRDAIRALVRTRPTVNEALWCETLVEASIFREWVLNVGRRDARSRIAHMLCEFAARCEAAGVGGLEGFRLPMTQLDIADATGLTPVHVNRMLRALREDGVIAGVGKRIEITDWARMREVADFDSGYLHLARERPAVDRGRERAPSDLRTAASGAFR